MTKQRQPWEQQCGEPPAAYAHFLLYRNLGVGRSIDAAYASTRAANSSKRRASGVWFSESVRWNWQERATSWDIAMLSQIGQEAIVAFAAFLKALSAQALTALADPTVRPKSWEDLLHTAEVMNSLIDPAAVTAVLSGQRLRCV